MTDKNQGFTLVELLVVIGIIIILMGAVVLTANPFELKKRNDDDLRMADLLSLKQAITIATEDSGGTSQVLCSGSPAGQGCTGYSDNTSNPNNRSSNGSGWVKIDLTIQKSVPVPRLPIDPLNNSTYRYSYATNTPSAGQFPDKWEINTVLESGQQKDTMKTDGGDNDNVYEIGTDLTIIH